MGLCVDVTHGVVQHLSKGASYKMSTRRGYVGITLKSA